ncbi:MAG: LytTR family transcriptional regulator DNA-binding domain-containing protein [Acidobacteriota bacterium]|nr:LytTR family transcriptional regulator DNA-binding domain-containing protein [Acidobacteriota bacterium]MDQ3420598.1 LytTR family transcriptional regulator DNA-binding domain-containing protein [Acidobacteriota bacterium]
MSETRPARIRTLIADDEPLARERLRMLLAAEDWIELVGDASDGVQAIDAIQRLRPELVFLDIQMPGATGFEVIESIGADQMPFVVFVTAYDQYALKAFDVHAIDYLLKPFDKERFRTSLTRARQQLERRTTGELERRLIELMQELRPAARMERFVIKASGRVFFVRAEEIDWIEAAGNYVKLHVGSDAHLFRETMNALESRLHPDTFYRIHRSHIVNIERIRELQPWFNGEYVVFLKDGTRLTLSRGYREKLQERLGRTL